MHASLDWSAVGSVQMIMGWALIYPGLCWRPPEDVVLETCPLQRIHFLIFLALDYFQDDSRNYLLAGSHCNVEATI